MAANKGVDVKLTPLAKALVTLVVVLAVGIGVYSQRAKLFPGKKEQPSSVPPKVDLGDTGSNAATPTKTTAAWSSKPGCADKPEVRLYHWAWNAQMGMMFANGGQQAAVDSLMCKHGVNLKLVREDDTNNMQTQLATFAEAMKGGEKNPSKGAHFIIIMGDGGAQFFKAINDRQTNKLQARNTRSRSSARPATAAARTSSWGRRPGRTTRRPHAEASSPAYSATATGTSR